MSIEKIFPTCVIILQLAAFIVYIIKGNYKLALFWFAVALANIAVTY